MKTIGSMITKAKKPGAAAGKNIVMYPEDRALLTRLCKALGKKHGVVSESFVIRQALKQLAALEGVR